ncbi:3'(2'),5'-bisphosphate nucleotidase 1-like [Convolutriloba macropyga]|uniref:3'(2'),5'-bisphosphate nucleotidase 1-like n=1 Tax=Convolutriloba macropyga TaxID=536237 RepID=UPI003F527666
MTSERHFYGGLEQSAVLYIFISDMSACCFARVLATSVNLAKKAGQIARDVRLSGDLSIVEKGVQDFQTEADRKSQELIIGTLSKLYPKLNCVGEEEDVGESPCEDVGLHDECLTANYPSELSALDEGEVTCWVDPLDGTKEYTDGGEWIEHVTVLIGLSVGGRAMGGVIHQPFYKYSENKKTSGRTIWGAVGVGAFGLSHDPVTFHRNRLAEKPRYTSTRSHSSPIVNELFEILQPCDVVRLGGSGHKVLAVLDGTVDAYVYPSLGLKKWDSCAPEAIITAAGGYFTDITGKNYTYSEEEERMNWMGALSGFGDKDQLVSKIPQSIVDKVVDVMNKKKAAKK